MKKVIFSIVCLIIIMSIVACGGTSISEAPQSGTIDVFLHLEGGSGRASVEEKSILEYKDGIPYVTLVWSSPNYDYMIVEEEKYYPVNDEGNSVFEIKVPVIGEAFTVIGDTVAMSTPHEIEYQLTVAYDNNSTGQENTNPDASGQKNQSLEDSFQIKENVINPEIDDFIKNHLTNSSYYPLEYAKGFTIQTFDDEISIITINSSNYYLCDPGNKIKEDICPKELVRISNPEKIYIVGTASMDYFVACDSLDKVKYASLPANEWHLEAVAQKLENKEILYAGKYSAPDYEMLLSGGCDLIIENTMISHNPDVYNKLQSLGFPVIIDCASYEDSILGRMEWVKLYGYITGKAEYANEVFEKQKANIESIQWESGDEVKAVGFFSITSQGTVQIRKSQDYICNVIELAGGRYAFEDLEGNDGTGSTTVQLEAFYEIARDCDILIYNGTISGEVGSLDELTKQFELLEKCKAYAAGNIYCTSANFYQSVMELGDITQDINKAINGDENLTYLDKLK